MNKHWTDAQSGPDLAANDVHVWLAHLPSARPALELATAVLSPDERERIARFRFEALRERSTLTRGILRWLLGHYLQTVPEQLVFTYGPHGKPALASTGLHFNTSHSGDYALFAFTHAGDVGVDIEQVRGDLPRREEIARRHFAPGENERLRTVPEAERTRAFFELWTRKEAFVKARGAGLFSGLERFEVSLGEPRVLSVDGSTAEAAQWQLIGSPEVTDYCVAAAVKAPAVEPHFWKWSIGLATTPKALPNNTCAVHYSVRRCSRMDSSTIKRLVEDELARGNSFTSCHGITPANLRSLLVEPFAVRTDPDDLETQPRDMWVVLQERPAPTDGYVIVYDPTTEGWGVAEHTGYAGYALVVSASSLAEALSGM